MGDSASGEPVIVLHGESPASNGSISGGHPTASAAQLYVVGPM